MNEIQKNTSIAIVNIFETGKPLGDYGKVVYHRDDLGQLTYGKSQTTLTSGNLYLLVKTYVETPGARFADALRPYLPKLRDEDPSVNTDASLHSILKQAGDDPVMQKTQDAFFDETYWKPAVRSADYINVHLPLSLAIIYDSRVHGSWHARRDEVIEQSGHPRTIGEKPWMIAYVKRRKQWLAGHRNPLLPITVYRMEEFEKLIADDKWDLALPLTVRGHRLTADLLGGEESAPAPNPVPPAPTEPAPSQPVPTPARRLLKIKSPMMNGEDVRQVQAILNQRIDAGLDEDGWYGNKTERAVRLFQEANNASVDGIVGPETWSLLEPDGPAL